MQNSSLLAVLGARLSSNKAASTSTAAILLRPFSSTPAAEMIRVLPVPVERPALEEAAVQDPMNREKEDLVQRVLSQELMSNTESMRVRLQQVRANFQRFEGDTGSTEVQVGLLTEKITNMASHMQQHRKDFSSRRGLEGMLNQRRKLLQYLRKADFDAYTILLVRLGLKDNYAKQDRMMRMQQKSDKQ